MLDRATEIAEDVTQAAYMAVQSSPSAAVSIGDSWLRQTPGVSGEEPTTFTLESHTLSPSSALATSPRDVNCIKVSLTYGDTLGLNIPLSELPRELASYFDYAGMHVVEMHLLGHSVEGNLTVGATTGVILEGRMRTW